MGGGGGGTDWVGKKVKLTSLIFPLWKKLTGQFFPRGKKLTGEKTDCYTGTRV